MGKNFTILISNCCQIKQHRDQQSLDGATVYIPFTGPKFVHVNHRFPKCCLFRYLEYPLQSNRSVSTKMFSSEGKTLLRNIIRHTDTHNRLVEENEMWRQKNMEPANQHDDRDSQQSAYGKGDYSGSCNNRRAHMDDLEPRSTHWMRELEKFESQQPDRWGHGGYKELYPDDFKSDRSESEEEQNRKRKKKRKKEKKSKKRKKSKHDAEKESNSDSSPHKYDEKSCQKRKRQKEHKKKSSHKLSDDRKIKSRHKRKGERDNRKNEHERQSAHADVSHSENGSDFCRTKRPKRRSYDRNVAESHVGKSTSSSSESD